MKTKKIWLVVLSFFLFTSVSYAESFEEDQTLSGNLTSDWYYVNGSIFTQGSTVIADGVNLDLIAQTKIEFNPGFEVQSGGILQASVSPDSDGDLILDMVEDRSCLSSSLADTDGDGLSDSEEDKNRNGIFEEGLAEIETNACSEDTDGDKIDDKWELDHGLDPLVDDADLDPDNDKLSNYLEYYFDKPDHPSDPQNGNSLPPKGSYYVYDELGRIKKIIRIK